MNSEIKQQLLTYLLTFVSDHKLTLFDKIIQSRTRHVTVVLEDIYQSQNASAVLRSCDCFGVQDVHVIENRNIYEVNDNVALGSSKWLNLVKYNSTENNTLDAFKKLRADGYKIVATTPHTNDQLIDELPLDNKIALVFGTEMEGVSQQVMDEADEFVKIPMYGFTESFNISVSAALSLYCLTEKLRKSDISWALSEEEALDVRLNWARNAIKKADAIEEAFLKSII